MERIIRGTDNGNPRNHYTMLTMDATKQKLIVYDDRSSETEPPAGSMLTQANQSSQSVLHKL